MEKNQNYYEILNVSSTASQDDIRKKYLYWVSKIHPDRTKDPKEKKQFLQIQQAYKVLSNTDSRKQYDDYLKTGGMFSNFEQSQQTKQEQAKQFSNFKSFFHGSNDSFFQGFQNIFEDLNLEGFFNGSDFSNNQTRIRYTDVVLNIKLTFFESALGGKKKVEYQIMDFSKCCGQGCSKCLQSTVTKSFVVDLPAPLTNDISLVIKHAGHNYVSTKSDVILELQNVDEDFPWSKKNLDIFKQIVLTPKNAIKGTIIHETNIYGDNVMIKLPDNLISSDILKIKNGGLRYKNQRGDFYLTLIITTKNHKVTGKRRILDVS